jgi:hypothetical protein
MFNKSEIASKSSEFGSTALKQELYNDGSSENPMIKQEYASLEPTTYTIAKCYADNEGCFTGRSNNSAFFEHQADTKTRHSTNSKTSCNGFGQISDFPLVITRQNWRDFFGNLELIAEYSNFFQKLLQEEGTSRTLENYVFHPEMLHRLKSGSFQTLVRLGYGIESQSPAIIAKTLAQAALVTPKAITTLSDKDIKDLCTSKMPVNPATDPSQIFSAFARCEPVIKREEQIRVKMEHRVVEIDMKHPFKIIRKKIRKWSSNDEESYSPVNLVRVTELENPTGQALKNVVKNYGKQIIKFIKHPLGKKIAMEQLNGDTKQVGMLALYMKSQSEITNMNDFRNILIVREEDGEEIKLYKEAFKAMSIEFVQSYSHNWIFNSNRIADKWSHIYAKPKILRRLKNPEFFTYLT